MGGGNSEGDVFEFFVFCFVLVQHSIWSLAVTHPVTSAQTPLLKSLWLSGLRAPCIFLSL